MRNPFKRWREVPEKGEFDVVAAPGDPDIASEAVQALLSHDPRSDRLFTQHPGVYSLEGDWWAVHHEDGMVFLAGEDGVVQVQFSPVDAYTLGTLLQQSSQE